MDNSVIQHIPNYKTDVQEPIEYGFANYLFNIQPHVQWIYKF